MNIVRLLLVATLFALPGALIPRAGAEALTLKRAVELALIHSPAAGEAAADEQRALASYRESRNQYLPQVTIGSGLGDSWGYPLTLEGVAPSLVNATAQSPLFNPGLRDYIRAARSDYKAAGFTSKDQRNQIIQDTVLIYLELMTWEQLLAHLQEQQNDALRSQEIIEQRVQAGIDHPQLLTRAKLAAARAKLHLAQADGAMHELRMALSQMTGLQANSIEPSADSVPGLPEVPSGSDVIETAASASPTVLFAGEHAITEGLRAKVEHKALWPTVDFASQYAVLAKFNNWLQFFPNNVFQRNNATIGVVIRFPIFNASQRAHAQGADAAAVRANREAEAAKNQVSQQVLKLQDSVRQLTAAKEVSDLEYDIAKSNSESSEVRVNAGTAAVTEAATARAEMFERYTAAQDADFALLKARIGLLRATGDLESWVEHKQ
jgi:outer membrane protein TolC